jgi:hypothetical protein
MWVSSSRGLSEICFRHLFDLLAVPLGLGGFAYGQVSMGMSYSAHDSPFAVLLASLPAFSLPSNPLGSVIPGCERINHYIVTRQYIPYIFRTCLFNVSVAHVQLVRSDIIPGNRYCTPTATGTDCGNKLHHSPAPMLQGLQARRLG